MISVAEKPKPIQINGEAWKNAPHWMDKNYIFKHGDTYYLSWGQDYAISKNIYGPYESVGAVGNGHELDSFAHGSFFKWKNQFYHIWCYYIRPGYKYRESIITYCHFDDDGKIVTDTKFLDEHFSNGVGQYDAKWEKIEAEWFYEASDNIQKKGNREQGFVLSSFKNGDWVRFANMNFDKEFSTLTSNLLFQGKKGKLELRANSLEGKILGTIDLKSFDRGNGFQNMSCEFKEVSGKTDIYLVFRGTKKSEIQLDWIRFE